VGNQEAEKKVAPNYNFEIAEIQEFRNSGIRRNNKNIVTGVLSFSIP
jgi:hypothetical protein